MKNKTPIDCPTEEVEQTHLIRWADHHWFGNYLFAIPNGGLRNKVVAAKLKAQGVRRGVPDLFLAVPSHAIHRTATVNSDIDAVMKAKAYGLFIEMKRKEKSNITQSQKDFHNLMMQQGYDVEVCYGWLHAAKTICAYLGEKCDVDPRRS